LAQRPVTEFGALLRDYRVRAGYSQKFLAEKARVGLETIGALERGFRRAPYPDTLALLVEALELSRDEREALKLAASEARAETVRHERETNARRDNLPLQLTPLVGREKDVRALLELIAKRRLVTIVGTGGVGKTRTVLEVAARHAQRTGDEVWLVDLAALDQSDSVPDEIASVAGGAPLASRKMLLIIDNCERLISHVATTASMILQTCPDVNVLVASSELLDVAGETPFRLQPLSLPNRLPASIEEARRYSALELFIRRAESESDFVLGVDNLQKTAEICLRLDGIPRAIELAAARLAALGLRDLHSHLEELGLARG
jgi:transcriptional regulator with XRE-family HTH domain